MLLSSQSPTLVFTSPLVQSFVDSRGITKYGFFEGISRRLRLRFHVELLLFDQPAWPVGTTWNRGATDTLKIPMEASVLAKT